jgi:hypothetical protein
LTLYEYSRVQAMQTLAHLHSTGSDHAKVR